STDPEIIERATIWRIEGVIGPHWGPDDLRLVIDFHLTKSRYLPRMETEMNYPTNFRAKILVVEDDILTAGVVVDAISSLGQVIHVETRKHAKELLLLQKFDLIILDIFLPDGNGMSLLQEIRKDVSHEGVPVLMFSNSDHLKDKIRSFEYGANDFILKPVHIEELLARTKALLGGRRKQEQLLSNLEQMTILAQVDGLTGLYNYRHFIENLRSRFSLARERNISLAVLMCDVDDFKQYNDSHGHLAGDHVLKEIAKIIRSAVRHEDIPARYGGEEFAALLWDIGKEHTLKVAMRIKEAINTSPLLRSERQPRGRVTVSMGLALTPAASPEELIQRADEALYRAKSAGKNSICL
ncbi:MAG TPA: diguanylate cyclase, partial [Clostridia bacterium]|nr:diguanylate cyclase [Clostridia bacterium]